jgi:hypothetical protein
MSGALLQLVANETYEDQTDFTKKMTLFAIAFFVTIIGVWILKLVPKTH